MSHFFTIVLCPKGTTLADAEGVAGKLLDPFHEFECTGRDDQYVQDVDKTAEYRGYYAQSVQHKSGTETPAGFADYCKGEYEPVAFGETPDLTKAHKYGYTQLDEAGNVARIVRRTNPNKKWDWYCVGGRWDRALLGKDERYRDTNSPHGGEPSTYGNILPVSELPDDISCFAVLTPDGEWIERGKMGWWACVSNEKSEDKWATELRSVLTRFRDCVAVGVDCHI